jgi:hypothetical protein
MTENLGQDIIDGVDKYGLYVVNVLPSPDGSDGDEVCSYTIGLGNLEGWSELICFGRAADEAQEMLRLAIRECWDAKVVPSDGLRLEKVIHGRSAKLVRSDEVLKNYFGLAEWYAGQTGRPKPKRLQLMWPDRNGRLPGDEDCDPTIRAAQTPRLSA